jgi:hypothetical protein
MIEDCRLIYELSRLQRECAQAPRTEALLRKLF